MSPGVAEDDLEQAALGWLDDLGYTVVRGRDIAPGEPAAERDAFADVVLKQRFYRAFAKLNPGASPAVAAEALHQVTHPADSPSLIEQNRAFHRMLVNGVEVEHQLEDGSSAYGPFRLADFDNPEANDWLAVNQFTVSEDKNTRRPDIVLFANGLPLAVIELKNPADENATARAAFKQLQTYKEQIPSLFVFNESLVASDGMEARIGALSAAWERFMPWRTVEGEKLAAGTELQLEVLLRGVFDRKRFLEIARYCTVFEDGAAGTVKKMAAYHQYHAVRVGVKETLRASKDKLADKRAGKYYSRESTGEPGDRRIGVVWHTQGSGKSLTMAFYAGWVALHPEMRNPTIVVLTDRNDLDQQLFGTFCSCAELLRQEPKQADGRAELRELLRVSSSGVVFTTIQKFLPGKKGDTHPRLSERENIVVIADEAHRSQYDFIAGFARHMRDALPYASFVGFTATPIESKDGNTRGVFGDDISVYDIARAQQDGATVPIYYESRLAKLNPNEKEWPRVDANFEEVTEGEEEAHKRRLKTKWSALESIVGADKRIRLIAEDLVDHFEQRLRHMDGKCMVVCMSRRICVQMFDAIAALRPGWRSDDDERGAIKVVMTGAAADPPAFQPHIRGKAARERLRHRFRDPDDPLRMAIVRDMWLTGFDAPCLHTMYVDKPMRGHGLMQAIARVNRVFRDKPGGLVVDYLGLANNLRQAVRTYTESRGRGQVTIDQEEAVNAMREKYEICRDLLHGCDWSAWRDGDSTARLKLLPLAQERILAQEDGKARFAKAVTQLSQAFALAVPREAAIAIRDDVGFFQAVRAALGKSAGGGAQPEEEMEHAIRQIVSKAIAPDGVIDVFSAAGLAKPDIAILSDEFLAEVRDMPHRNLAVELLQKLLREEIGQRKKKNVVQARSFAEMLEQSLRAYQNRAIETAEVIEQLIALAKEMREAAARGEKLGLNEAEAAFYDALETNDSAVAILGDETLKKIARELVEKVRGNVSIDWNLKESARAKLRVMVKGILRKYGYPPDKQERATDTVLEQTEVLCEDWLGTQA